MKPLVLITARGGSKGVPGKNIKLLGGKPLIQYTIDAARALFSDEIICVSTDDIKIKDTVESLGLNVPFLRPDELATDTAGSYEVMLHAIHFYESKGYQPDVLVLLQPTSPFRSSKHIESALALYRNDIDMVVSVKETASNPYYVLFEENNDGFLEQSKNSNFTRRQDCPKVWEFNGAIYIINIDSLKSENISNFKRILKSPMDVADSVDIDTPLDWDFAEFLLAKKL